MGLRVKGGAPEAALVEGEDDEATVGPALMDILVTCYMFAQAVNKDNDGTRRTRFGLVGTGIERRLGAREPFLGEAGHGWV